MSLKDLRSLLGYQLPLNTAHTKDHLVYDHEGELQGCVGNPVDPVSVAPGMEEEGAGPFLINLILAFYAGQPPSDAVQTCLNRYDIDIQEFKTLDLPYRVCIQDKRSKLTATNNSLVLLGLGAEPQAESAVDSASDAQPPDLGEVVRIYRMKVGSSDIPVEKRTLLLVRRYNLGHVDRELARCGLKGRVWVHDKHSVAQLELVDIHSVVDQAFVGDDPRKPSLSGGYFQQFVFSKGKTVGERLVAQRSR